MIFLINFLLSLFISRNNIFHPITDRHFMGALFLSTNQNVGTENRILPNFYKQNFKFQNEGNKSRESSKIYHPIKMKTIISLLFSIYRKRFRPGTTGSLWTRSPSSAGWWGHYSECDLLKVGTL